MAVRFNPAPGWPTPPVGWKPAEGWRPDPTWPPPPEGWPFWVEEDDQSQVDWGDRLVQWIRCHKVASVVVGVVGVFLLSITNGLAGAAGSNGVDVTVTGCGWGNSYSSGGAHAIVQIENTSSSAAEVYVEVNFMSDGTMFDYANDDLTLGAGDTAERVIDGGDLPSSGVSGTPTCEVAVVHTYPRD